MPSDQSELRRDTLPMLVCLCGHSEEAHDIEKKTVPCSIGACGCLTFRLAQRRWRVHGWVIEAID